jgi:hypothetical protein
MSSSQAVYLKAGDQPRAFSWGSAILPPNFALANGPSNQIYKEAVYTCFQAIVTSATLGALAATVNIQCSMDDQTGRGWIMAGDTSPGFLGITTAASATLTANAGGIFLPSMIGTLVDNPNVPVGTTVAAVAANGITLTMSSGAGVLAGSAQTTLFSQNWCATALGTITLTGTTTAAAPSVSDGFTTASPWRYVRAVLSAISGTGATVIVLMGN